MKKKIIIIAAVAVVALLVVLKMQKNADPKTETTEMPTGDEGKPNVKPANRLKIIRANLTEIQPENGISVQPANSRGNIV